MKNFEGFMRKFANENNTEFQWQQLKFGYKRAVIHCDSWDEFDYLRNALTKRKQIHADFWHCSDGGFFEGNIYIMTLEDYVLLLIGEN